MMPPLTHKLAEARALWKGTSPVTERIAEEQFLSTCDSKKKTSAPAPKTNPGRKQYWRKPEPGTVEDMRAYLFG